jgi:hypothetical protein
MNVSNICTDDIPVGYMDSRKEAQTVDLLNG